MLFKNTFQTTLMVVMSLAVSLPIATTLVSLSATSAKAQAVKGACRYISIVRGIKTEVCKVIKANESVCKRKAITGGSYRWCPGKSCEDCDPLSAAKQSFSKRDDMKGKYKPKKY